MKHCSNKLYPLLFSFLIMLFYTLPAAATSLLPLSLETLSSRATLIFYGAVISNQVKKDEISGRIVTFTEFEVIELIKGNSERRHTIKQLGGRLENSKTTLRVHGIPQYQVGKKYVVFLPGKSSLGFCSPLGLHQGSFAITTVNGELIVSNGHQLAQQSSNVITGANALVPLAVSNSNASQASLSDFINSIRALITR